MHKKQKTELISDIVKAQNELEVSKRNYNNVSNPDLIDMYAHKIIAARLKCDYLIKKAKNLGLISSFSPVQDIGFQRFQR